MKSRIFMSFMVIAMVAALIGGATMAWFTDSDNAGTATFTAGTLSIDVSDGLSSFDVLETSKHDNMNPGDVYDPIVIEITNTGSKKVAWFGNWTFTPGTAGADKLLDAMYIKSMKMEFLDANGNIWAPVANDPWYAGYKFIENGVGAGPHPSEVAAFNTLIDPALGVITLRNWNNNPTMVPGSVFEHMGALKPKTGNKYRLTVEIGFHSGAGNQYQGNAAGVSPITVGFEVLATQVNADAITAEIPGVNGNDDMVVWLNNQINAQP